MLDPVHKNFTEPNLCRNDELMLKRDVPNVPVRVRVLVFECWCSSVGVRVLVFSVGVQCWCSSVGVQCWCSVLVFRVHFSINFQ